MKIVNASKEEVLSILLAGDIIVINDSECYFDKQKDIYIFKRQDKIFYFKTLFDLSCFIAFNSSNIKVKGEEKNQSLSWLVLTLEKVISGFYKKQDAIDYCIRLSQSTKRQRPVSKITTGIYTFSSKSLDTSFYYIGLKKELYEYGFSRIIDQWEERKRWCIKTQQKKY